MNEIEKEAFERGKAIGYMECLKSYPIFGGYEELKEIATEYAEGKKIKLEELTLQDVYEVCCGDYYTKICGFDKAKAEAALAQFLICCACSFNDAISDYISFALEDMGLTFDLEAIDARIAEEERERRKERQDV